MKQVTTFKPKTYIVKVERYTAKNWGVGTIGIYKTLEEARIESGKHRIRLDKLEKIAHALDIKITIG